MTRLFEHPSTINAFAENVIIGVVVLYSIEEETNVASNECLPYNHSVQSVDYLVAARSSY